MLIYILALMAFAVGAFATPLHTSSVSTSSLIRRANPTIATAFSAQEHEQISRGLHDALQLADAVVSAPKKDATSFNKIFGKYFDIKHQQLVLSVFEKILGKDKTSGHVLLGDIKIVDDYSFNGKMACDKWTTAATRQEDPQKPNIIVCNSALMHGATDYPLKGVADINCKTLGSRVSWHMDTLGSILLHEYTHWNNFTSPLFSNRKGDVIIDDSTNGYGPVGVVKLAKKSPDKATRNADSYSWLANEVFWTAHCKKEFKAASKTMRDDISPYSN